MPSTETPRHRGVLGQLKKRGGGKGRPRQGKKGEGEGKVAYCRYRTPSFRVRPDSVAADFDVRPEKKGRKGRTRGEEGSVIYMWYRLSPKQHVLYELVVQGEEEREDSREKKKNVRSPCRRCLAILALGRGRIKNRARVVVRFWKTSQRGGGPLQKEKKGDDVQHGTVALTGEDRAQEGKRGKEGRRRIRRRTRRRTFSVRVSVFRGRAEGKRCRAREREKKGRKIASRVSYSYLPVSRAPVSADLGREGERKGGKRKGPGRAGSLHHCVSSGREGNLGSGLQVPITSSPSWSKASRTASQRGERGRRIREERKGAGARSSLCWRRREKKGKGN